VRQRACTCTVQCCKLAKFQHRTSGCIISGDTVVILTRLAKARLRLIEKSFAATLIGTGVLLFTVAAAAGTLVDGRAIADEKQGANWLSYGRTYAEHHYSPLTAINTGNVKQLGLAWSLDLPGQRALEATPLAVDGVLYFSGTYGKVFAVDGRSGRLLWEHDPDLAHNAPEKLRLSSSMGGHRGVAYWRGKVYVGVVDGRLFALDAKNGKVLWQVQTFDDPQARKAISGAPRVFAGKVIIGHGGAEYGTRGYVTAYDAETGKTLWRFYTVPGDPKKGFENDTMAMAAKSWSGEWWHWGGGGTVWDNVTYDPDFHRIYLGVGNGGPWNPAIRSPGSGDNLFLCSIVALDADTGRYVWHYQLNPRESWDYKATTNMILADLTIDRQVRKVLMQAPTNGFFYVLDRANGKLISAEKFAKATWARRIDLQTGRPEEAPNIRYEHGPVLFWPSSAGAHNWQPMSFNPGTGLVYIPTMKLGERMGQPVSTDDLKSFENDRRRYFPVLGSQAEMVFADPDDGTAALLAWDPIAQEKRWEVRYEDSFWNGGTMTTAGNLVFQGTGRGQFIAYDAITGDRLWAFNAGLGIVAAPITWEADGVQYISILVGYGGSSGNGGKLFDYGWRFNEQPRRIVTFALGRHAPLPPSGPPRYRVNARDDPAFTIDAQEAAEGFRLYHSTCYACHGARLEATGSIAPDLRESSLAMDQEAFRSVLREGALASAGMPKYDELSDADLRAIFIYIRAGARAAAVASRRSE
jgi:quinohemoprotein ethanol dehydrogenase